MGTKRITLRRVRHRIGPRALVYLVLIVFTITQGYPMLWMFVASLKREFEVFTSPWGLPRIPQWANYANAWREGGIGGNFGNSTIISVSTVLLIFLIGGLTGYTLARMRFPGRDLIYTLFPVSMVIQGGLIGMFKLVYQLGIMDTYLACILPYVGGGLPLAVILFTAYFQSLPVELEEAARVDGASRLQAFLRVVLPLSGPVFSAVGIFNFISAWNDLFWPMIALKPAPLRTLTVGLYMMQNMQTRKLVVMFAGLSIAVMPVLILYMVFQERFVSGLTAGAVKV